MATRLNAIGIVRLVAIAVVFAIVTGFVPDRAGAAALRDGTYTSDDFGYAVSYDESIWEAEEISDANGVRLTSDHSFGMIQAVRYDGELADCVAESTVSVAGQDGVEDFGTASRRMDRPESARGAEGELFTYDDVDGEEVEIAMYVECRKLPVEEALLQVILLAYAESYDDVVSTWSDLLGDVEVEGGRAAGNSRDESSTGKDDGKPGKGGDSRGGPVEAGFDGDLYLAPEYGFSVAIDADVWTVRELDAAEDMGTGIEVSTAATVGYIMVGEEQRTDFEECAVDFAEGIGEYEAMSRMRDASRKYDLPKTDRAATVALYTFTQEISNGPVKMIGYFECRLLPDGESVARILLATREKLYEDEVAAWEDLLAGIEIEAASRPNSDRDDETADARDDEREGQDRELSNDEASFIGPTFGFRVTVDEDVWSVQDLSADGNDILDLESEFAIGTIAGFDAVYDPESCLELMIELKAGESAFAFDVAPASMARPALAPGASGELFVYSVDTAQGPVELAMYAECRPLDGGDASLGIALVTVPAAYEVAAPAFERVLEGISTGARA